MLIVPLETKETEATMLLFYKTDTVPNGFLCRILLSKHSTLGMLLDFRKAKTHLLVA